MSYGILIIEDEAVLAKKIAKYLSQNEYETRVVDCGQDGLEMLETFLPDVVLLDFNLPGGLNGLEVLKRIRTYDSSIKVILITGQGNTQLAVDAMKAGAYDYLSKPIMLSGLKILLERAIGQNRSDALPSYYEQQQVALLDIDKIIGRSPEIQQLKAQITQIINVGRRLTTGTPPPVLITGETGTGKELVARALHFGGPRNKEPFIELNLATIPSDMVESELFGHERGAYTDAHERKMGLVESANGGTLFLDEVGELALPVQAKFLKFLEDYEVRRLGSVHSHTVDIQIVSATNRPLEKMVEEGRFRADLLFRLNTLTLRVPTLRERSGDILTLARHFVRLFGRKYAKTCLTLDESANSAIMGYHWPGNIRELRNKMEQAILLCEGSEISAEHLAIPTNMNMPGESLHPAFTRPMRRAGDSAPPAAIHRRTSDSVPGAPLQRTTDVMPDTTLQEAERDLVARALRMVGGNVSKAARKLGISRDQMRYRIEKYDLPNDN
jgi:two-component system, NtrC family, response regulator AtoC